MRTNEALHAARDAARAFAKQHSAELAKNLNDWQDTGLLPAGCKLRELREICRPIGNSDTMALAEGFANRACRDAAALASAPPAAEPVGMKLVPMIPTAEMNRVMDSEGWCWEDVLAAAGVITEDEYQDIAASGTHQPAAPQPAEPAQPATQAGADCPLVGPLAALPDHVKDCVRAYGDARARLAAQPTEQPSQDAERYRKLRAWFLRDDRKWSDIHEHGHMEPYTNEIVDTGVDALDDDGRPAARAHGEKGSA